MGIERRMDACLERDGGFAVPTVLLMMVAVFSIAMGAAVISMSAQRGAARDSETKAALAAAEAGVSQALLRYNRYPATSASSCVVSSGGTLGLASPTNGVWCAPVSGVTNQGTFEYHVSPSPGKIDIVSRGESNGVTRRIEVPAESASGQPVFAQAGVQAQDGILLDSNSQIRTNTATNGNITLFSNSKICGSASVGIGKTLTRVGSNAKHHSGLNCTGTGTAVQSPLALPSVNQGNAATVNDNGRFFTLDRATSLSDIRWNPTARTLSLSSNATVNLGGSVYSLCKLSMTSNAALYIAPGSRVTFFIDSPEACGLPSGTTQLDLDSNARITSSGSGPSNVAILMVGSETLQTKATLNSNTQASGACEQNFVIYAPRTDVDFDSNSVYCGALAAKSLRMVSDAMIFNDAGSAGFVLPNTAAHYVTSGFVECGSTAANPPDEGC